MAFQAPYSVLDRLLHRVAFAAPAVQMAAADLEGRVCARDYRSVAAPQPIFITSLPRAGTTLLLEALSVFPELATHSYRDMPFVMAPLLWSRVSREFRKSSQPKERAHGDGLLVGYDSPEAFEEVLWRTFWPEKFHAHAIDLWQDGDAKDEATRFFAEHQRKIVALRRPTRILDGRYLSKNNANLARLVLIERMFPGSIVVVPFRAPLAHAASLLRQHQNFLARHRADPFVRRYMADIGHFEFGELHRPIAFPGLSALLEGREPDRLDYWIAYWIAAFEHVLAPPAPVLLVCYEAACAAPREHLVRLSAALGIAAEDDVLARAAALFHAPPQPDPATAARADPALLARAQAVHAKLVAAAEGSAGAAGGAATAARQAF